MRHKSYFDRTPTIKTHEEMMTRLQERTQALVKALANRSAEKPAALQWQPRNRGENRILTNDGKYSVEAVRINGIWHYTAWMESPKTHLGSGKNADEAKKLCESDFDSLNPP